MVYTYYNSIWYKTKYMCVCIYIYLLQTLLYLAKCLYTMSRICINISWRTSYLTGVLKEATHFSIVRSKSMLKILKQIHPNFPSKQADKQNSGT